MPAGTFLPEAFFPSQLIVFVPALEIIEEISRIFWPLTVKIERVIGDGAFEWLAITILTPF